MTAITIATLVLLLLATGLGVTTIVLCEYFDRREERLRDKRTSRPDQS